MLNPLAQVNTRGLGVNTTKRNRDESVSGAHALEAIDLISDDDEAPAPKRQKSQPPATNGILQTPSTPDQTQKQRPSEPASVKGQVKRSPFINRPSWLTTTPVATDSSGRDVIDDADEISKIFRPYIRRSSGQTPQPSKQLAHPVSRSPSNGQPGSSSQFKLPPAESLRFATSAVVGSSGGRHNPSSNEKVPRPSGGAQVHPSQTTSHPRQAPPAASFPSNHQDRSKQLQVVVPIRSSTPVAKPKDLPSSNVSHSSASHRSVLFQHRPGSSQTPRSNLIVNVPLTQSKQKRRDLQDVLKHNTELARRDPDAIEKVLGLSGFSSLYAPEDEKDRMLKAAQPKKRKVDRSQVALDFLPKQRSPSTTSDISSFIHPRDQVKAILTDRFAEGFVPPLTLVNTVNDHHLNGKFQFIKDYIIRKGVRTTGGIPRIGCSQTCSAGDCTISCSCLTVNQDGGSPPKTITSYRRRADGLVVLTEDQINEHASRVEIIECDDHCPCSQDCINRVVQKGRTVPLEIFQTPSCGFGVRSTQDLERGQFIEIYLGEVLTDAELNRREEAAEEEQSAYVYSLDWFSSQNAYQIDGQNFGSAMRFVNHSCDPNARTVPVMNRTSTKNLYYIAFFAIKHIPAWTEITIDYIPQNALMADDDDNDDEDSMVKTDMMHSMGDLSLDHDQDLVECLCGAPNCRRRLWGGPKRKTRKRLLG